jgi:uncharacterized protein
MSEAFWLAMALVFLIEGFLPLFFPQQWKEGFLKIASLKDGQIRFVGFAATVVGLMLLLFFYPQ